MTEEDAQFELENFLAHIDRVFPPAQYPKRAATILGYFKEEYNIVFKDEEDGGDFGGLQ